jgi:hypothetical protein
MERSIGKGVLTSGAVRHIALPQAAAKGVDLVAATASAPVVAAAAPEVAAASLGGRAAGAPIGVEIRRKGGKLIHSRKCSAQWQWQWAAMAAVVQ